MSAPVTEHLPLLASAPDGIKKLRGLILELAVRGKLVPQDTNDEPASELLKSIVEEKTRLVAEGKTKRQKSLTEITSDEAPCLLPGSWRWVRLPEIYYPISVSGNKLLSSQIGEEGRFPVVDQGKKFVAGYADDEYLVIRIPGPVVVFGDHTTERKYVDFDFIAGADGVKILRPVLLDEKFFWWQIVGMKIEGRGYARHFKVLNDSLFALPPKNEQQRIVAKVEELMALCDRLEAQQDDAAAAHAQLVQTLLDSLTQAQDADDFAANWQRLSAHFDVLFTTEASIDALKQTILQLAVMGKLVPQDPNDEPAISWIARIEEEKARRVSEGNLRKSKGVGLTSQEYCVEGLPHSWRWVRLENVVLDMDSGWSPACESNPSPDESVWGVLKTTAVQVLEYLQGENKELPSMLKSRPDAEVKVGDILFTRAGPTNRVGISCLVESTRPRLMISDKIIRFHPVGAGVSGSYVALCLNVGETAKYLERAKSGMAASQVNISQEKLRLAPIPMAPLPEQLRIVAKVDELMSLCDQLKTQLSTARQLQEKLAGALVEQAVA